MVSSVEEVKKHPEFANALWPLESTSSGKHECGKSRGGPWKIHYQVHGTGREKLVLIMGLGGIIASWQRQTRDFGHTDGQAYSVLVVDNRGIGQSDSPLARATTSGMAADLIEVLDHVGWTEARQLNVVGISMGGMIAQEVAWAIPERIKTLALVSTAARLVNTIGFLENLQQRAQLFLPKPLDEQIRGSLSRQFTQAYVNGPDSVSRDGFEIAHEPFKSSGDRYAATEIHKKTTPGVFGRRGFMNQAWAAAWHKKSAAQLRTLADRVGRRRILVVHGTEDKMVTFPHGETLVRELNTGGAGDGDTVAFWEIPGQGHVVPIEMRHEFNQQVRALIDRNSGK